jgi:hypothetical protein
MRRVFAISLAIAVVMFTAGGVMAQETQQDGNDLLLKILKDRNILTDQEFQEIKGQLAQEQDGVDQKLSALDRSLADYLAKAGDSVGGNSTYVQNRGVTFSSGDGMWSIYFGGLFQFGYYYETGDFVDNSTGGFDVVDNRIDFGGTIFDPAMTFYVQIDADSWLGYTGYDYYSSSAFSSTSSPNDSFWLRDAWINYKLADTAQVTVGQFKVPYGRQALVDQSDRAFGHLNGVASYFRTMNAGRDVGVMLHDVADMDDNADGMKLEWNVGVWNGDGGNIYGTPGDHYLMYGGRVAIYPMGYIDYVEGDWDRSNDIRFGLGGSVFVDEYLAPAGAGHDNPKDTFWQIDGVMKVSGLYLTGEYFSWKYDNGSSDSTDTGWYLQGGYFLMPEFEVLARYGVIDYDSNSTDSEWALGVAYYFNGHEWKVGAQIGRWKWEPDHGTSEDGWFLDFGVQVDW